MKDKELIDLYTLDQHAETTEGITAMAIRFNVPGKDVIHALWRGGKDTVWAKLALDLKGYKGERKKEAATKRLFEAKQKAEYAEVKST
jgi:hypothetical protein